MVRNMAFVCLVNCIQKTIYITNCIQYNGDMKNDHKKGFGRNEASGTKPIERS